MDFLKDMVFWVSAQTGITELMVGWIGTLIVLPMLGWLTKKIHWDVWEKTVYVSFYGWAQWTNDQFLRVPFLGMAWEKWFEPYFIKQLTGAFRVIGQIPFAIVAGLNSRNESLVDKGKVVD